MLYDISPPLSPALAVWPGDEPLRRVVATHLAPNAGVDLSALHGTVHMGAHADAPAHVAPGAATIDACPLDAYLGECEVLRVAPGAGRRVLPAMLPHTPRAPRALLCTDTYPDPEHFTADFAGLSAELADALHAAGVRLVGVDTPSVDPFGDDALSAHRRLLAHGVLILEGLRLSHVPPGRYELIALPLRLIGFDGSPVRAVLRSLPAAGG